MKKGLKVTAIILTQEIDFKVQGICRRRTFVLFSRISSFAFKDELKRIKENAKNENSILKKKNVILLPRS